MAEYDYPGTSPLYGVVLNNGDVMKVFPGGGPASVTINDGGIQYIEGGNTLGVTINSGGIQQVDSGSANGVTINAGGSTYVYGGRVDSPYANGGYIYVGPHATVAQTNDAHGGVEYLSGSTISSTAYDGGRIILDQPGYLGDKLIDSTVTPNYIGNLTIGPGGTLEIKNGVTSLVNLSGNVVIDPVRYDSSVTSSYDGHTGILTVAGSTGSYGLKVYDQQGHGAADFILSGDPSGAVSVSVRPLCFVEGTRIATPDGPVLVENLRPGSLVLTHNGVSMPVAWVGGGRVEPGVEDRPIIIRQGAFDDNVPSSDLSVTAGHAFLFDDILIPIEELLNGVSIVRSRDPQPYRYFHVELAKHGVLLANGAPAETYRDDDNRAAFAWTAGVPESGRLSCVPVVPHGPRVDAVWERLARRAPHRDLVLSNEPDLHILVAGRRVDPSVVDGETFLFDLDDPCGSVVLASRSAIPAEVGTCRDQRRLGVAVRRCWLGTGETRKELTFLSSAMRDGFHAPEPAQGFRWTNGSAVLPPIRCSRPGRATLGVELGCRASYPS